MATKRNRNRNHGHKAQRAFPDQHPDVRLENCIFVIDDGRMTDKADVAIAAQRAGHTVRVVPKLRAIGRVVPPEEWVTDLGDPPQQTPSD